jgi:hypothetical protein
MSLTECDAFLVIRKAQPIASNLNTLRAVRLGQLIGKDAPANNHAADKRHHGPFNLSLDPSHDFEAGVLGQGSKRAWRHFVIASAFAAREGYNRVSFRACYDSVPVRKRGASVSSHYAAAALHRDLLRSALKDGNARSRCMPSSPSDKGSGQ